MKALALLLLPLVFSGCADLYVATEIADRIQCPGGCAAQMVREGRAPDPAIVHRCNQEGLVRQADGRWAPDSQLMTACFADQGWEITPKGWHRVAPQ